MVVVIDASMYVALINAQEAEHTNSWAWFQRAVSRGEEIVAPVIILAEIAAALSRGVGDSALARRAAHQLRNSKIIALKPITLELAARAAAIAADHHIRGCDSVYVALAEQAGGTLVTLDKQQLERGADVIQTRKP